MQMYSAGYTSGWEEVCCGVVDEWVNTGCDCSQAQEELRAEILMRTNGDPAFNQPRETTRSTLFPVCSLEYVPCKVNNNHSGGNAVRIRSETLETSEGEGEGESEGAGLSRRSLRSATEWLQPSNNRDESTVKSDPPIQSKGVKAAMQVGKERVDVGVGVDAGLGMGQVGWIGGYEQGSDGPHWAALEGLEGGTRGRVGFRADGRGHASARRSLAESVNCISATMGLAMCAPLQTPDATSEDQDPAVVESCCRYTYVFRVYLYVCVSLYVYVCVSLSLDFSLYTYIYRDRETVLPATHTSREIKSDFNCMVRKVTL